MSWKVYGKSGIERCEIHKLEYSGEFMGERFITASIKSPVPIEFEIGDYFIYRGERFTLNYDPSIIKKSEQNKTGDAFTYENIKFNSFSDELVRCEFLDYVRYDNLIHFSSLPSFGFYAASVQDLADRIQANLNRVYSGDKAWTVVVHPEYVNTTNVPVSADRLTVWGALALVSSIFKSNFIIRGRTITIGTAGSVIENIFEYGKGKGLNKITRVAESDQQIITRLRVYGSTRNMPTRYYNKISTGVPNYMAVPNLMLPSFPSVLDSYLDSPNISELGVMEGSVFFDGSDESLPEIYPSLEGMTGAEGNLDEVASGSTNIDGTPIMDDGVFEGEDVPPFKLTLKDIGFDINEYLTAENNPVISMKNGMCGGREFEILSCEKVDDNYVITCDRIFDEGIGLYFPYRDSKINQGDKFVLLNIEMPDVYIQAASQRLLNAGLEYLSKNDYVRYTYELKVSPVYMARKPELQDSIIEGDYLMFSDEDLNINGSLIINSLRIKEGDQIIPSYEVVLSEEKRVGTLEKIQNQINLILSGGQGIGINTQQVESLIRLLGNKIFLSKISPDTAQEVITFLEGAHFGSFSSGMQSGQGGRILPSGDAELTSLILRSFLEAPEIRHNRETIIGMELTVGDSGIIENVIPTDDPEVFDLKMKLEEGELITFWIDDILKGIYHYGNGFNTSWFRIISIHQDSKTIRIVMGSNESVPGGRNYPPRKFMHIAHRGNFTNIERQTVIFMSAYEGKIMMMSGVNNYGGGFISAQWGKPKGLENIIDFNKLPVNLNQSYLYLRGLLVQDIFMVDYQGVPIARIVDRGVWSLQTANDDPYKSTTTEQHEVWVGADKYRCIVDGTLEEPGRQSSDWILILSLQDQIDESNSEIRAGLEEVQNHLETAEGNINDLSNALSTLENETLMAMMDNVISESERISLKILANNLDIEQEQLLSNVSYVLRSIYIDQIHKDALQDISDRFLGDGGSIDKLQAIIYEILDHTDPTITDSERYRYETALTNYHADKLEFTLAIDGARDAIDAELKRRPDYNSDKITGGGNNILREYDLRFNFKYWGETGEFIDVDMDSLNIVKLNKLADDNEMLESEDGDKFEIVL